MKKIILGFVTLGVAGLCVLLYFKYAYASEAASNFRTTSVKRGEVVATIATTGTVQPEEVVDVGAQVTGRVVRLNDDPRGLPDSTAADKEKFVGKSIDYCTPVKEGYLIAELDDSVYRAQLEQARANLTRAKADLEQMKYKRRQTELDWERAVMLKEENAIPKSDYDLAEANYQMAKANVAVGEAVINQNQAALDMAEKNFSYTKIFSPIDGVVISRRVNVGQTVVSNMSVSSLFLLAKDLRKMEVWALVNEADIGRIHDHPDMAVRFKVDAYPHDVFHGRISQIRLNASSTQNVVLYTVVVSFDNPELKVLPYMTASLLFEVERKNDVLKISNTALRWKPKLEQVVPELREKVADLLDDKDKDKDKADKDAVAEKKTGAAKEVAKFEKKEDAGGRLWAPDGAFVRPIEVQKGISDGTLTEISGPEVKEDMEVVIGEKSPEESGDGTNPFLPKIFKKR
jgi:HlyD family secretion protein